MALGVDIITWPLHGPSDAGHTAVGALLGAAAIAAAGYNAYKAVEIATQEWQLAKKYWQISQNWLDHYKNNYAPVEDQELSEARSLEVETPLFDVARGRSKVAAWSQAKGLYKKAVRCSSKYCTGFKASALVEIDKATRTSLVLADNLGYRNERAYVETRNDVRFEKMLNTVKRGRDMVANNTSLARASAGIYGDLYDQTWKGLVGAGEYLGYHNKKNETVYPTTYMSNTSGTMSSNNSTSKATSGFTVRKLSE